MRRSARLISSLPLGWTSACVLLAMALVWSVYPTPAPDEVPAEDLQEVQLALDRLQARLTGDQVRDATSTRRRTAPAYGRLEQHVGDAALQMPAAPEAVRVWVPGQVFERGLQAGPVEKLVLIYERVADGAEALGLATELPPRSSLLESRWYTSETLMSVTPDASGTRWRLFGTTPVFDRLGRSAALIEARLDLPRERLLPVWPRHAAEAVLLIVLLVFWEASLGFVRKPLRRYLRVRVSTSCLGESAEPDPRTVEAQARIDRVASAAQAQHQLWPLLPVQHRAEPAVSTPSTLRVPRSGQARAGQAPCPRDIATPPPEQPVVSATIENDSVLRQLLEILLPHVKLEGQDGKAAIACFNDLSLRVTIEIRRRPDAEARAKPAEESNERRSDS